MANRAADLACRLAEKEAPTMLTPAESRLMGALTEVLPGFEPVPVPEKIVKSEKPRDCPLFES